MQSEESTLGNSFKASPIFPTQKALDAYLLRFKCHDDKSPYPLSKNRTTLTKYLELETWTPEQAASLVAGIDPDTIKANGDALTLSKLHMDDTDVFVIGMENYAALNQVCVAANAVRIIGKAGFMRNEKGRILRIWHSRETPPEKVTPSDFATWCKSKNIDTTWLAEIDCDATDNTPTVNVKPVRGITKQQVMNAFEGLHFDRDKWEKYTASPPKWLEYCRIAKGNKKTSATWNPVLIASALFDKKISTKRLDAVFVRLPEWNTRWQETSATFRD